MTHASRYQNKEFSLILLKFDVNDSEKWHKHAFTEEMIKAIRNNYHLVDEIGGNYIYEPNGEEIR